MFTILIVPPWRNPAPHWYFPAEKYHLHSTTLIWYDINFESYAHNTHSKESVLILRNEQWANHHSIKTEIVICLILFEHCMLWFCQIKLRTFCNNDSHESWVRVQLVKFNVSILTSDMKAVFYTLFFNNTTLDKSSQSHSLIPTKHYF